MQRKKLFKKRESIIFLCPVMAATHHQTSILFFIMPDAYRAIITWSTASTPLSSSSFRLSVLPDIRLRASTFIKSATNGSLLKSDACRLAQRRDALYQLAELV